MKSTEWEIIQKNWEGLTELYPADVQGWLIKVGALTYQDKEKISRAGTNKEKMGKLLDILGAKPDEVNAYRALLEAIKNADGQEGNKHLYTAMINTKTDSDPRYRTAVDPRVHEEIVREVLLKNYTNRQGRTKLVDILETLQKQAKIPGGFNWKKEDLMKFLKKVFGDVSFEKDPNRRKSNMCYVVNLIQIQKEEAISKEEGAVGGTAKPTEEQQDLNVSEDCPTDTPDDTGSICSRNIGRLDHVELNGHLKSWFSDRKISTDVPEKFEEAVITGQVFLSMSKADIKEVVPDAPFGIVKILLDIIEDSKEKKVDVQPSVKYETLRKFDCELSYASRYVLGGYAHLGSGFKRKKTDVVRNFHRMDITTDDVFALDRIGTHTVEFISACLNERQNGTIYFGIDESSGEVTGVRVTEGMAQDTIDTFTERVFTEEQLKLVKEIVRKPVFVPVVKPDQTVTDMYVVEVDVVPSHNILDNTIIKTKRAPLIYTSKSECKKGRKFALFCLSEDFVPKILQPDEQVCFHEKVAEATRQRKAEEALLTSRTPENLRRKLLNLLTGGREVLEDVIYPFIILSPFDLSSNADLMDRNLKFIKQLQAEAVFDFDSRSSRQGIFYDLQENQGEILRVITLDGLKDAESNKTLTEDILSNDGRVPWIFSNGYEANSEKERNPTEWNKQVRAVFSKCLQHYSKSLQRDRILVILCLFSKQYETMIEGCEEMLTMFPDQWALIADSDEVAAMWMKELIYRKKIEENDTHERCVIGMPWDQINNTISQATMQFELQGCLIPQSTGNLIPVPERTLKSWSNVQIVSASDPVINGQDKEIKLAMERFYKGESVEFLNFSQEGQVLMRSCHSELVVMVRKALSVRVGDDTVTSAIIFHQPGAGGTTSAMHVLWELRKEYRCCVLKTISLKTCQQLVEIRKFSDSSPKPLLILVDDEDKEKYLQLKQYLEEEGRSTCGERKEVFCTILSCIRRVSPQLQLMSNQVMLLQKLSKQEQGWFVKKHEQLESAFRENSENIDPKHLISFNILKSNFNPKYTEDVVKKFVEDIKDEREIILFTFVALLNVYDLSFRKISVSCFDKVFKTKGDTAYSRNEDNSMGLKRSTKWEANLSSTAHVLLSLSPVAGSARYALRVNHKLIAKALLEDLKMRRKKGEREIMSELINLIFEQETEDLHSLRDIVGDIMKKRQRHEDGSKDKFSPFITHINETIGEETALQLLCDFFERSQDPFIAQQISRFYYTVAKWKEAERYAIFATDLMPNCSFLWDTYGLVYKTQLIKKLELMKTLSRDETFSCADAHSFIDLAVKAIDYFRKEQKLSETHFVTYSENNFSGYFGELKT